MIHVKGGAFPSSDILRVTAFLWWSTSYFHPDAGPQTCMLSIVSYSAHQQSWRERKNVKYKKPPLLSSVQVWQPEQKQRRFVIYDK